MNEIEEEFNTSTILHEKRHFSSDDDEDDQLSISAKSKISQHRERLSKYAHLLQLQGGGNQTTNNENAYDGGSSAG